MMDEHDFDIMPAHIMKPLHPKYNTDMDYKEFANFPAADKTCRRSRWARGSRPSTRRTSC